MCVYPRAYARVDIKIHRYPCREKNDSRAIFEIGASASARVRNCFRTAAADESV